MRGRRTPSGSRSGSEQRPRSARAARAAISVSVRCWRQPTQVIAPPPRDATERDRAPSRAAGSRGRRARSPRGRPRAPPSRSRRRGRSPARAGSSAARCGSRGSPRGRARRRGVRARAGEQTVAGEDLLDRAGELRAAVGEDDQVIADALEVGDDVRREDDRDPASRPPPRITPSGTRAAPAGRARRPARRAAAAAAASPVRA